MGMTKISKTFPCEAGFIHELMECDNFCLVEQEFIKSRAFALALLILEEFFYNK